MNINKCSCGGELTRVKKTLETFKEAKQNGDKLTEGGRTVIHYTTESEVWLCAKCGAEQHALMD